MKDKGKKSVPKKDSAYIFLSEIAHEVSNFKKDFKGNIKYTYILNPSCSSSFDLKIMNGEAFLGVPEEIFDYFFHIRWYSAAVIKDRPGIYLICDIGVSPHNRPIGIRIFARTKRAMALAHIGELNVVRINNYGDVSPKDGHYQFKMRVAIDDALSWEHIRKE